MEDCQSGLLRIWINRIGLVRPIRNYYIKTREKKQAKRPQRELLEECQSGLFAKKQLTQGWRALRCNYFTVLLDEWQGTIL